VASPQQAYAQQAKAKQGQRGRFGNLIGAQALINDPVICVKGDETGSGIPEKLEKFKKPI